MNILKRTLTLISCACVVLVSGCVKLWQDNLDIKTYMVEVHRDTPAIDQALGEKLWIDTVSVLPPSNVRNLILRKNDVEYSTSYYTELLMSPSENFRNAFFTWFAASGVFEYVSIVERIGMSHRLVVTVVEFHGDTGAQKAVLKIKATLFDEKEKGMNILFSNDYSQEVQLADTTAEELIRAYNKALHQILSDCEGDVVKVLR